MTIYLSGPMTGIPNFNRALFNAEAARLRTLRHKVFNPAEFDDPKWRWNDYLAFDVAVLIQGYSENPHHGSPVECAFDMIAQLPGWKASKGACIEHSVAKHLGLKILPAREIA